MEVYMKVTLFKTFFLFFVLFVFFGNARTIFKNEQLTTESWKYYDGKQYASAIEKAKECIIEFQQKAKEEQQKLLDDSIPVPPIGKVEEVEKQKIFYSWEK